MIHPPHTRIQTVHGIILPITYYRNAIEKARAEKQTENRSGRKLIKRLQGKTSRTRSTFAS